MSSFAIILGIVDAITLLVEKVALFTQADDLTDEQRAQIRSRAKTSADKLRDIASGD